MKKVFISVILTIIWSASTKAQFYHVNSIKMIKELQQKELIVQLSNDAGTNAELNEFLKRRWTFGSFKVVNNKEMTTYKDIDKYMYLNESYIKLTKVSAKGNYSERAGTLMSIDKRMGKLRSEKERLVYTLGDGALEASNGLAELLRRISLMNRFLVYAATCKDEDQLGYGAQSRKCAFADSEGLKDLTLLVRKDDVEPSIDEIKKVYLGKIVEATNEDFADAILKAKTDIAILTFDRSDLSNMSYFIIQNAANGNIYSFISKPYYAKNRKLVLKDFKEVFTSKKSR